MIDLFIVVEGQTEEAFVKNILAPSLWKHRIHPTPIILGSPGKKGGHTDYQRVKNDVTRILKQHRRVHCSMMIDLYGLGRGFPGDSAADEPVTLQRALKIEKSVGDDISGVLAIANGGKQFIPYIQVCEFEALLFSDPRLFATAIGREQLTDYLQRVRDQFETPEDINVSADGAPSKRILQVHRGYRKVIDGLQAAQAIGLEKMLSECPHFSEWVHRLATLSGE